MARRLTDPAWPPPPAPKECCALCGRSGGQLTRHHLVPRSQGRRHGQKVSELPTALLCPACHKFLHRTFSNAELETQFSTLEALKADARVARFIAWVKKQPASKAVRVR